MAHLGDGTVVQVLVMKLTRCPGLQLMHRVAGGIEIVMTGDLGQRGTMEQALPLMAAGPGQEFTVGAGLTGRISRQGKAGLRMELAHGMPPGTVK